jgi:hypothetical protein
MGYFDAPKEEVHGMKIKLPKIGLVKIDKKIILALLVLGLIFSLNMCANPSRKDLPKENQTPNSTDAMQNQNASQFSRVQTTGEWEFDGNLETISSQENNQININKGGMIARNGQFYYYADSKMGLLYRVRLDGTGRQKVYHAPRIGNINIYEGWIYFTSRNYDKNQNLLSSEMVKVHLEDGRVERSNLHAGVVILDTTHIYFTNLKQGNRIYRTDHNFSSLQKITNDGQIRNFYLEENAIYYLNQEGIVMVNRSGGNKKVALNSPDIKMLFIHQNWFYYMTRKEPKLFIMPIGKPEDRKILLSNVYDFDLYADMIFYSTSVGGQITYAKIGDITESIGKINGGSLQTLVGSTLFLSEERNGWGYTIKENLETEERKPLASDIREVRLGIHYKRIADHVALNMDYDDRNTITRHVFEDLGRYFEGNSIPLHHQFLDIDQNYLNEGFVIFRSFVSENSTQIPGFGMHNGYQTGIYVFRWNEKKLNVLGPYPLKQEALVATGSFINPRISLYDITNDGKKEVLIELDNHKQGLQLNVFSVNPVHMEPLEAKNYRLNLSVLGYKF